MVKNLKTEPPKDSSDSDFSAARVVSVLFPRGGGRSVYDYAISEQVSAEKGARLGSFVYAPLGTKKVLGILWGLEPSDPDLPFEKLKFLDNVLSSPPLPEDLCQTIEFLARYNVVSLGAAARLIIPAEDFLKRGVEKAYFWKGQDGLLLTKGRKQVHEFMDSEHTEDGFYKRKEIALGAKVSLSVVNGLIKEGALGQVEQEKEIPDQIQKLNFQPLCLSADQERASFELRNFYDDKEGSTVLLDGVTGAGKTEVYFDTIEHALKDGKQALVLLPEIALSTQWLKRFESRFGFAPCLWNSSLTPRQKREVYQQVRYGKVSVLVGARSALFLPFESLGVIVVDEEHDSSFKQEDSPLYNARDMAVFRGQRAKALVILSTATASLETVYNVIQGRYRHISLQSRAGASVLPEIRLIDLDHDKTARGAFLSSPLRQALKETLERGQQSLLYLNRRGYAPLVLCKTKDCGYRFECENCSANLVHHQKTKKLICHHCGVWRWLPKNCPSCHEESLYLYGPGVERIHEEVKALFPTARIAVLSSDTLETVEEIQTMIERIETKDVDIIIGTQLVTKGHDFPHLKLVGIVDGDLGLIGGDFRSAERSYQVLHQVSGRAGRRQEQGLVLIQTHDLEHPVMKALSSGDREAFWEAEMEERRLGNLPPLSRVGAFVLSDPDEKKLEDFARTLARLCPKHPKVRVLGPAPADLYKVRNRFRQRFFMTAPKDFNLQAYIQFWLRQVKLPSSMRIKVDIDPYSFY